MYYNNKRLCLSIFWILLGAVLVILSCLSKIDQATFSGMGAALIVVGSFQVARNIKYRRDSAYKEKIDVEANDERNRMLRMKSWAYTGYITVIAGAIASVIAMITGDVLVQQVLLYVICFVVFVYFVSYVVLEKRN